MKSNIFLIQMGHNSRPLTLQAIKEKYADGVILSPSDFEQQDNKKICDAVRLDKGIVLFDPHWYLPRSERPKLKGYSYFDKYGREHYDTIEAGKPDIQKKFNLEVLSVEKKYDVDAYISPSKHLDSFSETKISEYLAQNNMFINLAKEKGKKIPILSTLALSGEALIDKDQRKYLLNSITSLRCDGFYISICFSKERGYPLSKASTIVALLDLLQSLKNNKYYVLVGHTHHISHLLFTVGIDGFATGHYKNLRTFEIGRWETGEDKGGSPPALNYYSKKLLNDLRVDHDLDLLYQADYDLSKIKSNSPFEEQLFNGVPSLSGWRHRDSWDHFLWCCNEIKKEYENKDFKERVTHIEKRIEEAKLLYEEITKQVGILSQPDEGLYAGWLSALKVLKTKNGMT